MHMFNFIYILSYGKDMSYGEDMFYGEEKSLFTKLKISNIDESIKKETNNKKHIVHKNKFTI